MTTILAALDNSVASRIGACVRAGTVDAPRLARRSRTRADERPPRRARHDGRRWHCAADDHGLGRRSPRRGGRGKRRRGARDRREHHASQLEATWWHRDGGRVQCASRCSSCHRTRNRHRRSDGCSSLLRGRSRPRWRRVHCSRSREASVSTSSHCTSTTGSIPSFTDQPQHEMPAWTREFIRRYCPWGIGDVQLETRIGKIGELVPIVAEQCSCDLIALGWSQQLAPGRAPVVQETLHALARAGAPRSGGALSWPRGGARGSGADRRSPRGTGMTAESRVFVVTCPVPPGSREHLSVTVAGRTVTALSPHGFRHEFELAPDALADELEWQLFGEFLEIRVPYRSPDDRSALSP